MKHIYNPSSAATTLQSATSALGTALSGKILTLLLLSFFMLVSGESVGQRILPDKHITFDDETGISSTFNRSLVIAGPRMGSHNISSGTLRVQSTALEWSIFGYAWEYEQVYDGHIDINPSMTIQPGYEYQVSIKARTTGTNGTLSIKRGTNASRARGASGANIILSESPVNTTSGLTTFDSNKFSVNSGTNLYLALGVYSSVSNSSQMPNPVSMILDDLIITRTCIIPAAPIVASPFVNSCGSSVQISVSGGRESWERYRWYGPDGNVLSTQTSENYRVSSSGLYYVSKVNTATECTVESPRVPVQVNLGVPAAPIVSNTIVRDCNLSKIVLQASGASNGQEYRWYTQENGGTAIDGAITDTFKPTQAGTYYVCIRNAAGCEGPKVAITVEILEMEDALTDIQLPTLEAGKSAVLTLTSALRDNNQVAEYKWSISINGGAFASIGENSFELNLPEVPNGNLVFQCILTPHGENCYSENSFIATTQSITPLPVELISFNARRDTRGVNLTWATASELENKGFEVQVSTDSRNFTAIGFVESKVGTTSLKQEYSFLDTKAVSGTRYYRLKQIDFDGTTSFSPVRSIALDGDNGTVSAYPNPFTDVVTVKLTGTEARQVRAVLSDAMGKVLIDTVEDTAGNSISIATGGITTRGIYILHVFDNGKKSTFKLMKQ